jgi:soluble lytic murein transglycosylase
MENRLFAGDNEAALRAAHRLGDADLAIARARIALNGKGGNAKKLLAAVPAEAHHDPGYIFAQAHVLRHEHKIAEAAQALLSAPRDLGHDPEAWWVERRVLSRNLLDIGDARSAYSVVRDADEPIKENSRVERHFMAGWIALRFLDDPAAAAAHFARIQDVGSIRPRWRVPIIGSGAWRKRPTGRIRRASNTRRRRAPRLPITGSLHARASGLERSRWQLRRRRRTSMPALNGWSSFARWKSSMRSTSAPW